MAAEGGVDSAHGQDAAAGDAVPAAGRRRVGRAAASPDSTSSSCRGCPAPARPRPRSSSRTSATPASTTCRASCSRGWRTSSRASPPASTGSRSCWTCGRATRPWRSRRCAGRSRAAASGRRSSSSRRATRPSSAATPRRRHRHPLAGPGGIATSIAQERRLLASVRAEADVVLDTSDLSLRELKERIFSQLWQVVDPDQLAIQLISFGYKFGVPLECDLVFDVRFLQNPYYVPELRRLSGLTDERPGVRPRPAAGTPVPGRGRGAPGPDPAGLSRRGQDAAHDRDRVHRRIPPLDRAGRGDRRLARGAGPRPGQRLPSRARARVRRA